MIKSKMEEKHIVTNDVKNIKWPGQERDKRIARKQMF